MYPEKLEPHHTPYYKQEELFPSSFCLARGFVEYNNTKGMHQQNFFEINIIIGGSGRHYIEEQSLSADIGDVFIIPPNVSHGYVGGEGFAVYHLLLRKKFLEKYASDLQLLPGFSSLFKIEPLLRINGNTTMHLTLDSEQLEYLNFFLNDIKAYDKSGILENELIVNSETVAIIARMCSVYHQKHSKEPERDVNDDAFIKALSFIYEKYYEKLSIARLAKEAQLSRTVFIKRFTDVFGISPMKFLCRHRIDVAKNMLTGSNRSVSEIATDTGFYDSSHMIKCFIAEIGVSPSAYRKAKKN